MAASASSSRCEGDGLERAIVRQANVFTIIACDDKGERRTSGGDEFAVQIRGCGVHLRVKVADHGDGSYTASYNPESSGEYTIGSATRLELADSGNEAATSIGFRSQKNRFKEHTIAMLLGRTRCKRQNLSCMWPLMS